MPNTQPIIQQDAVVFGLLMIVLGWVFTTSHSKEGFWKRFYTWVPPILICYFIPALFNSAGIINGQQSGLYKISSRYLLPASLVLLTLSIDLKALLRLGPKALVMFLAGTLGIMLGGPLALLTVGKIFPSLMQGTGDQEVWRGLATVAGSWIGGGANQTAMLEVFGASKALFSQMIAVDVLVGNVWMAFLLYWAGKPQVIDRFLKADSSAIHELQKKVEQYQQSIKRERSLTDWMKLLAIAFGITGLSHFLADIIAPYIGSNYPQLKQYSLDSTFFWIVVFATTGGLIASFTKARSLEGAGASTFGSLFLYVLVATIGMQMDLKALLHAPVLFLVGIMWMFFHIVIMLIVAKWIKAPFFYVAVGSQANVGGAASAPVVASAFHPSLAPVGVLLAVLGYAVGTYGAYISGLIMQWIFQLSL